MATLEIHSNSRTYTTTINGEERTAGRVEMDSDVLNAATHAEFSGGNMRFEFPDGVDWQVKEEGGTFRVFV